MPKRPTAQSEHVARKVQWMLSRPSITIDTVATACGIKKPSVYDWRDYGRVAKKHIPVLAQLTGTSERWWLSPEAPVPPTGEWLAPVSISADQHIGEFTSNVQVETVRPYPSGNRIPVVGTAQLGDNGHFVELEYPAGHGDGWVDIASRDPNAYALRCRGDSMRPRIRSGEFVVVEPGTEPAPGDEVLIKATDGRVMIKTYLYRREGRVHLVSVNEAHPSIALDEREVAAMHYVGAIVKASRWTTG